MAQLHSVLVASSAFGVLRFRNVICATNVWSYWYSFTEPAGSRGRTS